MNKPASPRLSAARTVTTADATPCRKLTLVHDLADAPDQTLLTTAELAALTGFAEVTLRQWRDQGRGPKETRVEGRPRYLWGDVKKWPSAA